MTAVKHESLHLAPILGNHQTLRCRYASCFTHTHITHPPPFSSFVFYSSYYFTIFYPTSLLFTLPFIFLFLPVFNLTITSSFFFFTHHFLPFFFFFCLSQQTCKLTFTGFDFEFRFHYYP